MGRGLPGAPQVIIGVTLVIILINLSNAILRRGNEGYSEGSALDLSSDLGSLTRASYNFRVFEFFLWLCGFLFAWWVGGILVASTLFVIGYMRVRGSESLRMTTAYVCCDWLFDLFRIRPRVPYSLAGVINQDDIPRTQRNHSHDIVSVRLGNILANIKMV